MTWQAELARPYEMAETAAVAADCKAAAAASEVSNAKMAAAVAKAKMGVTKYAYLAAYSVDSGTSTPAAPASYPTSAASFLPQSPTSASKVRRCRLNPSNLC
jgi:hypothetical protein